MPHYSASSPATLCLVFFICKGVGAVTQLLPLFKSCILLMLASFFSQANLLTQWSINTAFLILSSLNSTRKIYHGFFSLYTCPVEKAMAPHSSTLAWKIPWTEEPGRLQSMGSLRVRYDWATSLSLFTFMHWRRKWQPTPLLLNPRDGRAWWAAVYEVAQSRTRLKWLSSSMLTLGAHCKFDHVS